MPLQSQPASPSLSAEQEDTLHQFFIESHRIATEAQFIIDSLPNADIPAVERILGQLNALLSIFISIDDPYSTLDERENLVLLTQHLIQPLQTFLDTPPPPAHTNIPRDNTGSRGRPSYILDLDRAIGLHTLGNTWDDIAAAMGTTRRTLYNHLRKAGISTTDPRWTDIDDERLDDIVAKISEEHPFSGSTIVHGHLESRGIHLPRLRVQESLRRVDALGVLIR